MGLFDFLKPKKNPVQETANIISNSIFPNGETDIDAGITELLYILDNKVDYKTARSILLRSTSISRTSADFDEDRLKRHLAGYCIQHFSEEQVKQYHMYLKSLSFAMMIHRKAPSEVRRSGNLYMW
jgi:hypothetical protein